jgi:3-deoxy-D-manno-octulosonic-acid transferase
MDQLDPPATLKPFAPSRQELTRSLLVYRLALPFAAALLLPGFLRRMFRRGNFQSGFGQRLGRFEREDCVRLKSRRWLWIRSISVGETLVALKLVRALKVAVPEVSVVLSVTTSTGYALASAEAADGLFPM